MQSSPLSQGGIDNQQETYRLKVLDYQPCCWSCLHGKTRYTSLLILFDEAFRALIFMMTHTFQQTVAQNNDEGRIVAAARQRILHQPHLTIQRIWCDFDAGKLFLRGQVPSFYYKQLAQEAVARLEGVSQVVNEIEVVW